MVDSYNTVIDGMTDKDLEKLVAINFDLRPGIIIQDLKLKRPIYKNVSLYNHFFPCHNALWEIPKKFWMINSINLLNIVFDLT